MLLPRAPLNLCFFLSLSLLFTYLDGSLKLERSPFKTQATP
jgi:hypothetical protein